MKKSKKPASTSNASNQTQRQQSHSQHLFIQKIEKESLNITTEDTSVLSNENNNAIESFLANMI